jgi:hypothetical protein
MESSKANEERETRLGERDGRRKSMRETFYRIRNARLSVKLGGKEYFFAVGVVKFDYQFVVRY